MYVFQAFRDKLKDFIKYITTIWGFLETGTNFFPLMITYGTSIPVISNYKDFYILAATIASFFGLVYMYSCRHYIEHIENKYAVIPFIGSIILMSLYLYTSILGEGNIIGDYPQHYVYVEFPFYVLSFLFLSISFNFCFVKESMRIKDENQKKIDAKKEV
jgi:hypothetical protein